MSVVKTSRMRRFKSICVLLSLMVLIFGGGRSPTAVFADTIEHTHIWATTYDNTNHWEYCTVCGEKRNVTAHTFTDHWQYHNTAHCYYSNYSTRTCDCGYSYIYRESHTPNTNWHISIGDGVHFKTCSKCGTWLSSARCKDSNGASLSCTYLGTCATCGAKYTQPCHNIGGSGTCGKCGTHVLDITNEKTTYSSDHKTLTWTATVKPAAGHTMSLNFYFKKRTW